MTSYPGYAVPVITRRDGRWIVGADPWKMFVGWIDQYYQCCTAHAPRYDVDGAMLGRGQYVGMYPDMQAAGEALVRHAGYELLTAPVDH